MKQQSFLLILSLVIAQLVGIARGGQCSSVGDSWLAEMNEIDDLLVEADWENAEVKSRNLSRRMMHQIRSGDATGNLLCAVSAMRAIALSGLGRLDEGLWYWHMAREFYPPISNVDLSRYGPAGAGIADAPQYRSPGLPQVMTDGERTLDIREPRKLSGRRPVYPAAKNRFGTEAHVKIEVVIDTSGVPREPTILESEGELTMVFSLLEAVGTWRFGPATVNGQPVDVLYILTSRFAADSGRPSTF